MARPWTNVFALMLKRVSASTLLNQTPTLFKRSFSAVSKCHRHQASIFIYTRCNFTNEVPAKPTDDNARKPEFTDTDEMNDRVILLRGFPYNSASIEAVQNLLKDIEIAGGKDGIHFALKTSSVPAELLIYVELASEKDMQKAKAMSRNIYVNQRYIEVLPSTRSRLIQTIESWGLDLREPANVVRIHGLPFGWINQEIKDFFSDLEIVPNGITPFRLLMSRSSEPKSRIAERADAFVEFASKEHADKALRYSGKEIGHCVVGVRPCEPVLYKISQASYKEGKKGFTQYALEDLRSSESVSQGNRKEENVVYVRGLPYSASEEDIMGFFSPNVPTKIKIKVNQATGQKTGEAYIHFSTKEAVEEAVKKDKDYIGFRYIDVFKLPV